MRGCGSKIKNQKSKIKNSQPSKPPMPPVVLLERVVELQFAEIGPERLRHQQFGVGDLPEQKIADAHFAAGADEQVRIGQVGGVEVLAQNLFGDVWRVQLAGLDLLRNAA